MAVKLSVEERVKARLGYFYDLVPEDAHEKVRREINAEASPPPQTFLAFKGASRKQQHHK